MPEAGLDICPQCGSHVEAPPGEAPRAAESEGDPTHPEIDCPNCGQRLKRAVGGAWFLAEETRLDDTT